MTSNPPREADVFRPAERFSFADFGILFGCDFRSEMEFRVRGAAGLLGRGSIGTLILSGGVTRERDRSEAQAMREILLELGCPSERLLLESTSRTTIENVLHCGERIQERNGNSEACSIALITSDWHMAGAWMIARKHLPSSYRLYCAPQVTTCNVDVWSETIQCACLIRSELQRIKVAMRRGYPDPRCSTASKQTNEE